MNQGCGSPPALPEPIRLCGWDTLGNAKESGEWATMSLSLPRNAQDTVAQRCSRGMGQRGTPKDPWCQALVTPNQFPRWHSVANEATVVFLHPSTLIHTRKPSSRAVLTHPGCRQISSGGCERTQELACSTGSNSSAWYQNETHTGWEDALQGTRSHVALVMDVGTG